MTRVRSALASLLALVLLVSLTFLPASANDLDDRRAEAERKQQEAAQQLAQVVDDLAETDQELAQAYVDLQNIEAELPVAQATLDQANATYDTAQREADALAQQLADAEAEEATLAAEIATNTEDAGTARSAVAEMARQVAQGDTGLTNLEYLVGAKTPEEFVTSYNMSQTALRAQSSSLDSLQQTDAVAKNSQVRLDAVKEAISTLKTDADAKALEAAAAKTAAEAAKAEVERLITEQVAKQAAIESRKAAEQARQDELEAQSSLLTSDLQDIIGLQESERARIAQEQEAARLKAEADAKKNGGTPPAPPPIAPPSSGKVLSYPTAVPHITSVYGWRLHPVLGYYRLHAGTDFRAYCGTPIYASANGTVQWAKMRSGYGNQVMLNNGTYNGASLMTSYNHLTSFAVSAGQSVSTGDLVGYSGNTGIGTACHLHLEVYVNGATVDPMTLL